MNKPNRQFPCIAVVGPCSSGKSTLTKALKAMGYNARHPAQEHSYVADMWRRITNPDILIYLDIDYTQTQKRRPHIDGGPERLAIQHQRLAHARQHCHLYVDTSLLSPQEVQTAVVDFLQQTAA